MKKTVLPLIFGLLGGVIGSAGFWWVNSPGQNQAAENQQFATPASFSSVSHPGFSTASISTDQITEKLNEDFVSASELSTNSVVYIKTIREAQRSVSWMDVFFGGGGTQQVINSGSGVIFTPDGYIITNNHVIEKANQIEVIYRKKPYSAKLIGTDPSTDLAVLKIEGGDFPAIKTGSSRNLKVGEWVLAVGNPFNLNSTVTAGIVSAKGRDLGILQEQFPMESFIQTDAAINPGNSGGALINTRGELVGINTAIISRTGSYAGYGFAVPVDVVSKIANDLIHFGKVQKVFIGAEISDLDYETATELGSQNPEGVVLTFVHEEGPAQDAGLKRTDIIRSIDGQPIVTKSTFEEILSYHSPGDKVKLEVQRGDKTLEKEILLVNEEGTTDILEKNSLYSQKLGAEFEEISKLEKELYKVNYGVKIGNIRTGIAQQIGVQEGFILMQINNNKIETAEQAVQAMENTRGRVVLQGLNKDGRKGYYSYYY
ncbi:MAG: trypsin-like peptidase domain-containing protein [Bacteroidia bacterium]|nr:trypsin-like peptidase domain-containing protein [Bacteroidia bacterium]